MERAHRQETGRSSGQIVDFDEAMLDACAAKDRDELLNEAHLLASVFAPGGTPADLQRMAAQLSGGARDSEMDRHHARRLAAALKHLARAA